MREHKKLLENSIMYTVANVLSKCISFFMLPLYTAYLSTEDYGIINLITSFVSAVFYMVMLSLDSALMRLYTDYKDNTEKLKRLYSSLVTVVLINSIIFAIICVIFNEYILAKLLKGISFWPHMILALCYLSFYSVTSLHRTMLQAMQKGKKMMIASITTIILNALFTLICVVFLKLGTIGMLIAMISVYFVYLVYMIIDSIHNNMLTICLDKSLIKTSLKYSIPLIPHNMSGYIARFASRIFLNSSSGLSTVGLFSVATQITSVIETFQDSVGHAYRPWLNNILKNDPPDIKNQIKSTVRILMPLYSVVYVLVGLFSKEVIFLMTNASYHDAWKAIPLLVAAYSLNSIYYFYIYQCMYYKDASNKIFVASISGSLANIIVSALLIPYIGMLGSAAGVMVSIVFKIIWLLFVSKKYCENIGYKLRDMLFPIFAAWLFIVIAVLPDFITVSDGFSVSVFAYKLFIFALYLAFLYSQNKIYIDAYITRAGGLKQAVYQIIKRKK